MKPSEAIDLVALALERWPAPKLDAAQQRRYAEDVVDLDADEARAALDALYGEGPEFRPNAGTLRRKVAALQLGAPDWAEVKRQLVERHVRLARARDERREQEDAWACTVGRCDGSGWVEHTAERAASPCPCRPAMLEARRKLDMLAPLVREFFDLGYATWAEVDALCSSVNTTLEAQMRDKWNRFAARAVESRVLASIEGAPDLPRLEEARRDDERRSRRGLTRPRFAALIGR